MVQSIHAYDLKANSWFCFQTIKLFAMQIKEFFEIDSYESFIHSSSLETHEPNTLRGSFQQRVI